MSTTTRACVRHASKPHRHTGQKFAKSSSSKSLHTLDVNERQLKIFQFKTKADQQTIDSMRGARVSAAVSPSVNESNAGSTLMEGTKSSWPSHQLSLLDLVALGAKRISKAIEGDMKGDVFLSGKSSLRLDSSSPMVPTDETTHEEKERSVRQTMPDIRTLLRTVRARNPSESVLGSDSQTVADLLVPGLGTDFFLRSPFENLNLEDSSTRADTGLKSAGARRAHVPGSYGDHSLLQSSMQVPTIRPSRESEVLCQIQESGPLVSSSTPHQLQYSQTMAEASNNSTIISNCYNPGYHNYIRSRPSQWADNDNMNPRPRSRAIAIKRSKRYSDDLASGHSEESSEKMYDWATWRMYNRIVDHRRNQRLNAPGPLPLAPEHPHHDASQAALAYASSQMSSSDYIHNGEVFVLEI
jgi:hypothetical protein